MDRKSPALYRTVIAVAVYAAVYALMAAIMLIPGSSTRRLPLALFDQRLSHYRRRSVPRPGAVRLALFPGSAIHWKKELCIRAGSFVGGTIIFYLLRPGVAPLWEAGYRGMMVCFAVFLLPSLDSHARCLLVYLG